MINVEKILDEFPNADSDAISATNEKKIVEFPEKISADVSKVEVISSAQKISNINAADEVPVHTAEAGQIDYWHTRVNTQIENLLSRYDLNVGTNAFDAFKIGVDERNHAVTFALDDTHYLRFDLNNTNVRPIDAEKAEKVLRRVNSIRFDKLKNFNRAVDDVPIYAATWEEYNRWFLNSSELIGTEKIPNTLKELLKWYDLFWENQAFYKFRVGIDTEKHALTFMLDYIGDVVHYVKIDLNTDNSKAIDAGQLKQVMKKVNAMRLYSDVIQLSLKELVEPVCDE